ncbi:LLM class flavin-dependent oxidoreductase [Subtercola sp. RTI3]|uniref:LLM class flavin-dependent oxidoreductase n=1 Tax=Subtercola sp. RTI3 TaxID=3048639 RepID=UPI002B22CAFE|nr:LLM class flavin-dependent oxidoreductase [Subtercola sp. RTI3]MEA9986002.1 LLM class flavin-dependent oxidoreductase [Subtercola sp. RTI3]
MLPRDLPAGRVVEFAQRADALGFDELWVVEDCYFRGGIAQAAVALASTPRIHVGLGILPAGARNTAFVTMEIATLAELFPGRVTAGIGHGMPVWMREVGAWPASPLALLGETLRGMRELLRGQRVTADGRYVQLSGVQLENAPSIVPAVLAGVRGPKSLALAGRHADGTVLAEPVTPEYLAAALDSIAARGPHRIVAYNVAAVDDDAVVARNLARPALEWVGEPDWAPHIIPLDFAADFAALRTRSASRAEFVAALPDAWVDRLAIVGTVPDARASLARLHDAGAHSVVFIPVGPDPVAALDSLARLL